MPRFTLAVHPDRPFGYVDGRHAQYLASIEEADPPHALAATVCDFLDGDGVELRPYVPLTMENLAELVDLVELTLAAFQIPAPKPETREDHWTKDGEQA